MLLLSFFLDLNASKNFSGTWSTPPFEKGLHLSILYIVSMLPLNAPNRSNARTAYTEHVGKYLQLTGR